MDRLERYLPPSVAIPLAVLALAGAIWMVLLTANRPRALDERPSKLPPLMRTCRLAPADHPPVLARVTPTTYPTEGPRLEGPRVEPVPLSRPPAHSELVVVTPPEPAPPAPLPVTPNARPAREAQPPVAQASPIAPSEGDGATPLFSFYSPEARSPRMEEFARQADSHTRRGFVLAGRHAHHSARSEFIQALRAVAQGLDLERKTHVYSEALCAGLTAMDEARDFLPVGSRLEAELDVAGLIARHRTPVLKSAVHDRQHRAPTAVEAMRQYLTYAQEQLGIAAGGEVAGSMALHALGKLAAAGQGSSDGLAEPTAVTFYQAALVVCPENSMASNDLGVMLARAGRYEQAEAMLRHSLATGPNPTTWRNLAELHQRLGQIAAAEQVRRRAEATGNALATATAQADAPDVQWVSPTEFARSFAQTADVRQPPPARRASPAPKSPPAATAQATPSTPAPRTAGSWLPSLLNPTRK
ncbi:MAG: hypothetical protein JW818_16520 [Pirellulales bacterium]|nr:hypothetical protein [Pirellulales bacterium]